MNRFDKVYLVFVLFLSGALFVSSRYVIKSIDTQRAVAVVSYFDKETQEKILKGDHVLEFENLFFTESVQDSMALNKVRKGAVVI